MKHNDDSLNFTKGGALMGSVFYMLMVLLMVLVFI